MKDWLRRVRGAFGVGLTWAAAWGLFGATLWLVRPSTTYVSIWTSAAAPAP